jgi:hypothetical protein
VTNDTGLPRETTQFALASNSSNRPFLLLNGLPISDLPRAAKGSIRVVTHQQHWGFGIVTDKDHVGGDDVTGLLAMAAATSAWTSSGTAELDENSPFTPLWAATKSARNIPKLQPANAERKAMNILDGTQASTAPGSGVSFGRC